MHPKPSFATLPSRKSARARAMVVVALTLLAGGMGWWWWQGKSIGSTAQYVTAPVTRGAIRQTVTASGSLKPVNTVVVGTQVTGPILKVHVDFNDEVTKGQLLAEIDPSLQQAQIQQTEAQLENAKSSLYLSDLNAARLKRLFDQGYVSRSEWERADQDAKTSRTSLAVTQAQLERDKKNLEYATVRAPVDGVIISRDVSEGQTVQGSFNAVEMFKIAEDLTKMQIELNLSEMDIGRVKEGQSALFTVDAYPERGFEGVITKLRLSPKTEQGVVSYTALVDVANPDRALLPGMTAYVNIIIEQKENALMAPTAALRFVPSAVQKAARSKVSVQAGGETKGQTVYILRGRTPEPILVQTGMYDDRSTEIESVALKEGDQVIVREQILSSEE